tara:strand:+ start:847 stop:1911 length:1065 start_codon:yes stop_codon:yes gene_type:complete
MNKEYKFEVFTSLENLKNYWKSIEDENCHDIFQSFFWQNNWFKCFGKNSYIILVLDKNNELIGILPFIKHKIFIFQILKFSGMPFLDYGDVLIKKNFTIDYKTIKKQLINFIKRNEIADGIFLDNIKTNSNTIKMFNNVDIYKKDYSAYQLIKINNNHFNIYKKFELDIRRQIRRLENLGNLTYHVVKSENELNNLMIFFVKHKKIQLKNTNNWNYLDSDEIKKFLSLIYRNNKYSHISYLCLDNKIISLHIGSIFKKKLFYLFPTYDQYYRNYSPGNVLLYNLLKDQSLNANEIDFTTGDEPYKLKISNSKTEIYFVFSSLNFKGSLIKLIILFKMYIKKILIFDSLYRKIFY